MMRHILAFVVILTISYHALAQPAFDNSRSRADVLEAGEIKALLAAAGHSIDRQRTMLKALLRDSSRWSEQDRSNVAAAFRSATNKDYEKQIELLTTELRNLLQATQRGEIRGPEAEYRYLARIRQLAGQLEVVVERQSAYLNQALPKLKPVKRP